VSDAAKDTNVVEIRQSIDLDAARAARRSKRGPRPSIRFLGSDRPLPYELPAEVIDMVGQIKAGDFTAVTGAIHVLLGGPVYDAIVADAKAANDPLALDDVTFLLEQALEVYGVTLPESAASES
jgi:hypothetical protein